MELTGLRIQFDATNPDNPEEVFVSAEEYGSGVKHTYPRVRETRKYLITAVPEFTGGKASSGVLDGKACEEWISVAPSPDAPL